MESLDIYRIMRLLPHRYPFLLVDRVLDYEPKVYLRAIKNVSVNEPFFTGHFPERPVMPGVLILEALAQATGLLAFASEQRDDDDDTLYLFVSIDRARFKRQVEPGDQVVLNVRLLRILRDMWKFEAEATVDGDICATARLMCARRSVGR